MAHMCREHVCNVGLLLVNTGLKYAVNTCILVNSSAMESPHKARVALAHINVTI